MLIKRANGTVELPVTFWIDPTNNTATVKTSNIPGVRSACVKQGCFFTDLHHYVRVCTKQNCITFEIPTTKYPQAKWKLVNGKIVKKLMLRFEIDSTNSFVDAYFNKEEANKEYYYVRSASSIYKYKEPSYNTFRK